MGEKREKRRKGKKKEEKRGRTEKYRKALSLVPMRHRDDDPGFPVWAARLLQLCDKFSVPDTRTLSFRLLFSISSLSPGDRGSPQLQSASASHPAFTAIR